MLLRTWCSWCDVSLDLAIFSLDSFSLSPERFYGFFGPNVYNPCTVQILRWFHVELRISFLLHIRMESFPRILTFTFYTKSIQTWHIAVIMTYDTSRPGSIRASRMWMILPYHTYINSKTLCQNRTKWKNNPCIYLNPYKVYYWSMRSVSCVRTPRTDSHLSTMTPTSLEEIIKHQAYKNIYSF